MKPIRRFTKTLRSIFMVLLFAGQFGASQAQGASHSCTSGFEFAVSSGPSAPLTLAGTLTMTIEASGAFTGTLSAFEGSPLVVNGAASLPDSLPVIGQANGHAISMLIKISDEQIVFGSGAAEADLSSCKGELVGVMGGSASGPQVGDLGDWLTRCRKFKDPERCD
jgi:hypothetical protein